VAFAFIGSPYLIYFFPPLLAFLASISCFAAKRAGDLYGRLEVFFLGLNAIIRVIFRPLYHNLHYFT
jgi:hypothetical protein